MEPFLSKSGSKPKTAQMSMSPRGLDYRVLKCGAAVGGENDAFLNSSLRAKLTWQLQRAFLSVHSTV